MKIISTFLLVVLCALVFVQCNNNNEPLRDIDHAIKRWNEVRDQEIIKNNQQHRLRLTKDFSKSEQIMRALAAEVPDEEIEITLKRYSHIKQDLRDRVSKKSSWYAPLTNAPQQLHLATTAIDGNVSIMWTTANTSSASIVCYRPTGSPSTPYVCNSGSAWTYTPISLLPWYGMIHLAYMTGLVPGNSYDYFVGNPNLPSPDANSTVVTFKAPNFKKDSFYAYLGGDMGTVQLFGYGVARQMNNDFNVRDAQNQPDALIVIGDLVYSTLDPPHDSFEFFWDWWLQQEQEISEKIPLLVGSGNHDAAGGDWAGYINRFKMPHATPSNPGLGNFYYATRMGPIKYVSMCTESGLYDACDYQPGSRQYQWIENELASVNRTETPWLILAGHRPFQTSDKSMDSGNLPQVIGELMLKYKVDINLAGHMHCQELVSHFSPYMNVTDISGVTTIGTNSWKIQTPLNTVSITAGALGAVIREKFIDPVPAWSLAHGGNFWHPDYGYVTMNATRENVEFTFWAQKTNQPLWKALITK